ncbi:glycosyltransferase [Sansalvadorimonas sp. 2012CJ34-2]|uniref:Glycosyltransferase n=1 Tax=Parendozoicomonas callyspongiae TaxID=2942213 RepID=A0ABT0PKW2_9GAMM|nr:glycosyltransferase [Sansalvadorimonas sp. 2012CJ34-2]MCL6272034.1 glycosyltransferase [Sansalvadorimonas sp. 2012CJ34-2]
MTKIAFITTVFPSISQYMGGFFSSLMNQTYNDFDIVIVNDGLEDVGLSIPNALKQRVMILEPGTSPVKNREILLNHTKKQGYDIAIWGDADDLFYPNRVEASVNGLKGNDIYVNELQTFGSTKEIDFVGTRLKNKTRIEHGYILDKNLFGMTNTAMRLKLIEDDFVFADVVAADWYLFSRLLSNGARAIYSNETKSHYRQHCENLVGSGRICDSKLEYVLNVRDLHFSAMAEISSLYKEIYEENLILLNAVKNRELTCDNNQVPSNMANPLWWELPELVARKQL